VRVCATKHAGNPERVSGKWWPNNPSFYRQLGAPALLRNLWKTERPFFIRGTAFFVDVVTESAVIFGKEKMRKFIPVLLVLPLLLFVSCGEKQPPQKAGGGDVRIYRLVNQTQTCVGTYNSISAAIATVGSVLQGGDEIRVRKIAYNEMFHIGGFTSATDAVIDLSPLAGLSTGITISGYDSAFANPLPDDDTANWPVINGEDTKRCIFIENPNNTGNSQKDIFLCPITIKHFRIVRGATSVYGGAGIISIDCSLTLDGIRFEHCVYSNDTSGSAFGGGGGFLAKIYRDNVTLNLNNISCIQCSIDPAIDVGSSGGGGGLLLLQTTITAKHLLFDNCSAGNINHGAGGGLRIYTSADVDVEDVKAHGCSARIGGGIGTVMFGNTQTFKNILIDGCSAIEGASPTGGSAMSVETAQAGGAFSLNKCTMTNNHVGSGHGALCISSIMSKDSNPTFDIENAIIYGNYHMVGGVEVIGSDIAICRNSSGARIDITLTYSDVGAVETDGIGTYLLLPTHRDQAHCLDTDPLFLGTGNDPYSLASNSHLIGAGTNTGILDHDIAYPGRTPLTCPQGTTASIGAYEFQPLAPTADFTPTSPTITVGGKSTSGRNLAEWLKSHDEAVLLESFKIRFRRETTP